MGVLCDYFIASDDDEAALTTALVGGPGEEGSPIAACVPLKGVMPWTDGLVLAAAALDRPESVLGDWMSEEPVAMEDEVVVVRMPEQFRDALSSLDDGRLDAVAERWSADADPDRDRTQPVPTGDAGTQTIAEMQRDMLTDLRALCRRASADGVAVYCWVCP